MTAPTDALIERLRGFAAALRSEAETDRDMGHDAAAKLRDMRADEIEQAVARIEAAEKLTETVRAFLAKYDECEPHINDAFLHRQLRCGQYQGPQLGEELAALRAAAQWQAGQNVPAPPVSDTGERG